MNCFCIEWPSAKLSAVNASAGRVLTYLASQLPYTYVNLVSFVSHVYLFVLATWFGFMLSSGLNQLAVEGRGTTRLARPRLHWSPYDPVRVVNAVPCLLYTSPSPRDGLLTRMPSSA